MQILNLQRLTEPKLKSLFSELKIHDKEELNFKKLKAEGKDKEGLLEADMRKRLVGKLYLTSNTLFQLLFLNALNGI